MPVAVIPAAGRSRRMGRPKPLLPFGEGTVVGGVVSALTGGGVSPIALVVAPDDHRLAAWGEERGLLVAVNPAPERGMLSSVLAGIERLGPALAGEVLLVCPADLPALRATTVARLLAALDAARAPLAVPVFDGRRGHPLAIAPRLVGEIGGLDPEVGLRQLPERYRDAVLEVESGAGAIEDVDTPEDYRRLAGRADRDPRHGPDRSPDPGPDPGSDEDRDGEPPGD